VTEGTRRDVAAEVLRGSGEVAEDEASGTLAELYARLRETLGVPFVPTVFRILAAHEEYLGVAVDALAAIPERQTDAYARRAVGIAARAAAELAPPPLAAGEALEPVMALFERYNQANSRGLLLLTAMAGGLPPARGVMEPPLPQPTGTLLDDVRACHGGLTVPGVWREFDHGWPRLAARTWLEIRRLALAPRFGGGRAELIEHAAEVIAPGTIPPPADLVTDEATAAEVERTVAWFARAIPTMVVEIECMRRAFTAGAAGR
jgi:hypothetical protein